MSEQSPSGYVDRFAEQLRRLGASPIIVGALAAIRYRDRSRFTTDADLLTHHVAGIEAAFTALGYEVRTMTQPGESLPYIYFIRGGTESVDVIVAETPYQDEAIARAVDGYLSIEDVLIHKLIAWRPRDQDDVRSILSVGHHIDEAYIDRWVAEWQVEARWDEARSWPL